MIEKETENSRYAEAKEILLKAHKEAAEIIINNSTFALENS